MTPPVPPPADDSTPGPPTGTAPTGTAKPGKRRSPHRGRWGVSPETVTAGAALVVGVCALAVSVFQAGVMREQARLMQEQQHTAAWPRLLVSLASAGGAGAFQVLLSNEGVGPAQVRRVEVEVDGRPRRTWSEALAALGAPRPLRLTQTTLGNRIVAPGQRLVPLHAEGPAADSASAQADRLGVSVCYCSVYERCWTLDESFGEGGFALPEPVERCRPADAPGGFEQ